MNKYYKKAVRKGQSHEDDARERLNTYLDICLSIYRQDTRSIEEVLNNTRKADELDGLFSRVVLE